MNEDEQRYMDLLNKQLEEERLRRMNSENINSEINQTQFNRQKDQNIIEYQLDLNEEIDKLYHLLSGHIIKKDIEGNEYWAEPDDDRLKIFSDYGVKQIMNIIQFYINRNTLLSNFDDETIWWKVRDFGIELTDLIFNRYEAFFFYPSPEQLYDYYIKIVRKNNLKMTERELYNKCVQWSKDELQSKLRHFPIIILSLIDSIHATLLRALNGEERESLRKQYNIHQSLNSPMSMPTQPTKFKLTKPSTWS